MKRVLLVLTVGVSFAFVIVSATARDLDGVATLTPRCTTGLIISQVAEVFAIPWQMVKPLLIRIGNQRKDIIVSASTTNGSMFLMSGDHRTQSRRLADR
jgi:hypothetical protein